MSKMDVKTKTKTKSKNHLKSKKRSKVNQKKVKSKPKPKKEVEESMSGSDAEESDNGLNDRQLSDGSVGSDDEFDSLVDHKKSLQNLKETDKEFYDFLQQNDKQLLDFGEDEDLDDDEEDNDLDAEEDGSDVLSKISVKQLDEWSEKLDQKADIETIKSIVKWFRKAVNQTTGESDDKILSAEVFNGIINICLIDLLPAIHKFLKLPQIGSTEWSNEGKVMDPTKSRNWKKVIAIMKCYLTDVIKMVGGVSDPALKSTLLRHILHLIPFLITFPHLIKRVLKQTIVLWAENDEKNRILAFICIIRLVRTQEQPMISFILKKLYISYVKNSKFMSESKQSMINFMKHSLVELYSLDQMVAYQHSFIFIRQLAINLRTAMTVKKKESYKSVYNWQFLNSILLWTQLLCSHNTVDELKPLISPLVNVIIGTIRLIPSAKYLPMRFHLIKALIRLSEETNTFIPVLSFITQVFDNFNKIKKNKSKERKNEEKKEINIDVLIKISNLDTNDFEMRDSAVNKVYDLILHYLSTQSHRIAFPELVHISIIKIRQFIKRSHVVQHNQLLKQLLDKMEENSKFINDKRSNVEFSISDTLSINSWESQMKCDGTPLNSFYNQRKNINANKDIVDINLDLKANTDTKTPPTQPSKKSKLDKSLTPDKPLTPEKQNAKSILKKRKLNESQSNKKSDNKSKRAKKAEKKRLLNNNNRRNVSFDVNQTLDISSDECE